MKEEDVCWGVLAKVSRSFALAIKLLPSPLKIQLNVAYLIYRLIDTIEDSKLGIKEKEKLFANVLKSISLKRYSEKHTERLIQELKKIDCTYEKVLFDNLKPIFKIFYSQEKKVKFSILKWGTVMKNGMMEFQYKKILNQADQTKYSYYVAGVVGYLFNDLLYYNKVITKKTKNKISKYAKTFGIALQRINIIRDVGEDSKQGRYFWPIHLLKKYKMNYQKLFLKENRKTALKILNSLLEETKKDIMGAIRYIEELPNNEIRIRIFCLVPLFMALESYITLFNNEKIFELDNKIKITRKQVYLIALKAALKANSNRTLSKWFLNYMNKSIALNLNLAKKYKL
ncbi:MAG: squalene/phytoene synthase family protein [Candidatus Anstonellaceae archaeon]